LAAKQEEVHAALTALYAPGGSLDHPPAELIKYFDDSVVIRTAKAYMDLQGDVTVGGHAVVVTAGPPGAGKSEARETMVLKGYRVIDSDKAKDMLLKEAEAQGLLAYRKLHVLPDGRPVGVRELASHIHSISTRTADVVRQSALAAGENVVIEGTLSWAPIIDVYIDDFFNAGYEGLEVVDVEAPVDVAIQRARSRWWDGRQSDLELGGRFVPDTEIKKFYSEHSWQSCCAANALALAERAATDLGSGTLRRFDVDAKTGSLTLSSETIFK